MLEDRGTWNLDILALLLCLVLVYGILLKQGTKHVKPILFLSSVSLFYVFVGSPITSFIELSFSLHMVQMGMMYFVIPPLFLLGIPNDMYEKLFSRLKKYYFLSPRHALYLFSILLFFYHVPFIFNTLSQSTLYVNSYEIVLFLLAIIMWWPLTSPCTNDRLHPHQLKRYVFKCGVWITPACLFFIVTAFIDAESNSFLTQMSAHLCIPDSKSQDFLPPFFQSKTDQFMAGVSMFGLHKLGLLMTRRLDKHRF